MGAVLGLILGLVVIVAVRLTIALALTTLRREDAQPFWPSVRRRFLHGADEEPL